VQLAAAAAAADLVQQVLAAKRLALQGALCPALAAAIASRIARLGQLRAAQLQQQQRSQQQCRLGLRQQQVLT
jgi:hypothetical protein